MSFVRNTASLMATSAIVMPIGFLTSVLLARRLPASDLGTYSVVISFVTVTTLLGQLGWPSATIYRVRRVGIPLPVSATAGLLAMTGTSALCVTVCWWMEDHVSSELLGGAPVQIFRYGLPMIPAMIFGRWFVGICRALERFDLDNAYRFSVVAGTLVVLVVVLWVFDGGLTEAVIGVSIVNVTASFVLGFVVLTKTGVALHVPGAELSASLHYGVKTYVQAIATQLHEQVDIFMLAALLTAQEDVAYYAIAVGVVNRLKLVPESVATALFPRASSLDLDEASRFTAAACRHSAVWIGLMMVALGSLAPIVVPLVFGREYAASVGPLLVLLPAMMGMTLASVLSRFFMAFDRQRVTIVVQGAATVANVAMNLFLIPRLGVLGAAFASLGSYAFAAVAMVWAFRAETRIGAGRVLLLTGEDLAIYRDSAGRLVRRLLVG